MKLSDAQIQQFCEQGYVAIPEFWDKTEVAAMQAEIERFKQVGLLRNVATDGDGKTHSSTKANLQLCPMSPHSEFYRAMPFVPKVVETVSQLIGNPVVLHLDQVFLKPGLHGSGTNWHQDNAYFKIPNPLRGTALWTAVHDATLANGTIHIIPGSFRQAYEHSRDPESDHHIRCYPPEDLAVPVELPAGGIVLFAYGTAHCTRGNTTAKERAGVALHFLNADQMQNTNGFMAVRPYLTGTQASGGVNEYGVDYAQSWNDIVTRTLGNHSAN